MANTSAKLRSAFWFAIPFGLIGLSYEYGYFSELRLTPWKYLGAWNFVVSGATIIVPTAVIVGVYAMVKKFFSKDVSADDWRIIKDEIAKWELKSEVTLARIMFLGTFIFAIVVKTGGHLPFSSNSALSNTYLYLMFASVVCFTRALVLLPPHSKASALTILLLSLMLCAYAGGTGHARTNTGPILRDDLVVKITRRDSGLDVAPRQFSVDLYSLVRRIPFR